MCFKNRTMKCALGYRALRGCRAVLEHMMSSRGASIKAFMVILLTLAGRPPLAEGDERLWVEARINGQPTRLIFDTGADRLILFPWGAKRLGLTVTAPPNEPVP